MERDSELPTQGWEEELRYTVCEGFYKTPPIPERRLWAAVIVRAVEDLCLTTGSNYYNVVSTRASARTFLFSNSPMIKRHRDFVFEMAGMNGGVSMKKLRRMVDEFESRRA